jgi:RNA polymerase sigma-70 factor (ECF subfamily)
MQDSEQSTRATLLVRIKNARDSVAWGEFFELYGPLLYRYARARGLAREDAEDVRAKCYESIIQSIGKFEYDKAKGGFKAWLRTMVNRRVADLLRKRKEQRADSDALRQAAAREPTPEEVFDRQWKRHHIRYCVERVRDEVAENTYKAFCMIVLDGKSVDEVCASLGMNANQVYQAKSRVLRRVRRQMEQIGYELDDREA